MLAYGFISGAAFLITLRYVEFETIIILIPIAILTLLYTALVFGHYSGIKEKPFLKSFLLAMVWAATTTLIPTINITNDFFSIEISVLLFQRFFFIWSIAIIFDIRDMEADRISGINTIPLHFSANTATLISKLSLLAFVNLSIIHYFIRPNLSVLLALSISAIGTYMAISFKWLRKSDWYYEGLLDGAIVLQALLVLLLHGITCN